MKNIFLPAVALVSAVLFTQFAFSGDEAADPVKTFFSASYISPENEANYNKGMDAASRGEWSLAIRYFMEVQKKSPYYSPLLFNLGLANQKAGNDLAAIAWFRAFLSASPKDKNASAILEEIKNIKKTAKGKVDKIYDELYNAANQIPEEDNSRGYAYNYMGEAQGEAGDFETAYQTIAKGNPDFKKEGKDFSPLYVKTLARLGDFKKAWDTLAKYETPEKKASEVWVFIGKELMDRKDFTGALKAIKQGKDSYAYDYAAEELINKKIEEKDFIFAEEIFKAKPVKGVGLCLAIAKIKNNDIPGAELVINSLSVNDDKSEVFIGCAIELLKMKNTAMAKKFAKNILSLSGLTQHQEDTKAVATAITGDYDNALTMADFAYLNDIWPNNRSRAFGQIAYIAILDGKDDVAEEALLLSQEQEKGIYKDSLPREYIALAYLDTENLEKALEEAMNIEESENPIARGDAIAKIAEAYIKKGDMQKGEELIKEAGSAGSGYVEPRVKPRDLLIKDALDKKDFSRAIELYEESFTYLDNMIKGYRCKDRFIELERLMKDQAKIGIDKRYINKDLAEWVMTARLISGYFSPEEEFKKARTPYDNAPADYIIKLTAEVARRMQVRLSRLELREKGNFQNPAWGIVYEDD